MNRKTASLLVLITIFAVYVHGQQFDSEADFKWEKVKLRDGTEVVNIKDYLGKNTSVRIPLQIQGMPVGVINDMAFRDKQLTSVAIPSSVIQIGSGAFANNKLTSISLPNGVTYIGANAFLNNQLTTLTIPNSVGTIGDHAFERNKLSSLIIENANRIGVAAFADNQLTSITIGDGVDKLEERMFGIVSFRNIQQISIGSNVSLFALFLRENSVVWIDFMNAYHSTDQRAGVYSVRNNTWAFQPR